MRRVGLLNDVLFKIVFGTSQSEPVLRALVNALLGLTAKRRIVELQILNPAVSKEYFTDKGAILDIKARDGEGQLYNVEVQLQPGDDYVRRSIFYLTHLFCDQAEAGQPYSALAKTIGISLLDFVVFPDREQVHSKFLLYEPEQGFTLSDVIELHYLELKKFSPSKPHEARTPFEKWLYILKFSDLYCPEDSPLPENLQEEEGIAVAIDSMRKAYARDEVRNLIEAREKAEKDYVSGLCRAHQEGLEEGLQRGLEQGLEKGLEQGLEKGLEQGLQKGRIETERALARRLLDSGMPREKVAEFTGLSPEELTGF